MRKKDIDEAVMAAGMILDITDEFEEELEPDIVQLTNNIFD